MTDSAAYIVEYTRKGKLYRQSAGSWRQVLQFAEEELRDGAEFVGIFCPGGPPKDPTEPTPHTHQPSLFVEDGRLTCAIRGGLQQWC